MLAKRKGLSYCDNPFLFGELDSAISSALYPLGHHKPRISFSFLLELY